MDRLLTWFAAGGGSLSPHVVIEDRPNAGLTLVARADGPGVAAGETIVSVPLGLCLSVENVRKSKTLAPVFDAFPDVLQWPAEVLAIALMHAATCPDSGFEWAAFIASLPSTVNAMLFWTDAELSELASTTAYHMTKQLQNQLRLDWEALHLPLIDAFPAVLGNARYEHYAWAMAIIYSRGLAGGSGAATDASVMIVPVLDKANHRPAKEMAATAETFALDPKAQEWRFESREEVSPGPPTCLRTAARPPSSLPFLHNLPARETLKSGGGVPRAQARAGLSACPPPTERPDPPLPAPNR